MSKPGHTSILLTDEQKALAYTREQLGETLYEKLKDDFDVSLHTHD